MHDIFTTAKVADTSFMTKNNLSKIQRKPGILLQYVCLLCALCMQHPDIYEF